jgi:hypothetical protein
MTFLETLVVANGYWDTPEERCVNASEHQRWSGKKVLNMHKSSHSDQRSSTFKSQTLKNV